MEAMRKTREVSQTARQQQGMQGNPTHRNRMDVCVCRLQPLAGAENDALQLKASHESKYDRQASQCRPADERGEQSATCYNAAYAPLYYGPQTCTQDPADN